MKNSRIGKGTEERQAVEKKEEEEEEEEEEVWELR
jgi:hypothetical protein